MRLYVIVPVARAQDLAKRGTGTLKLQSRSNLLTISGLNTKFTQELTPGITVILPDEAGTAEVSSIESGTSITLKKDFKSLEALEFLESPQGVKFKYAPKVDHSKVYNAVFDELQNGGCIGIYPEGGSHDRSDLLPLKGDYSTI